MRNDSTSFGACELRCWRWLFGTKLPIFLPDGSFRVRLELPREYTYTTFPSVSDASIDGACPPVGLRLGPCGDPRGVSLSYERGIRVG